MSAKLRIVEELPRSPGASRLRAARLACKLTQEEAGALRGINARQVRKLENNESPNDGLELLAALEELAVARKAA